MEQLSVLTNLASQDVSLVNDAPPAIKSLPNGTVTTEYFERTIALDEIKQEITQAIALTAYIVRANELWAIAQLVDLPFARLRQRSAIFGNRPVLSPTSQSNVDAALAELLTEKNARIVSVDQTPDASAVVQIFDLPDEGCNGEVHRLAVHSYRDPALAIANGHDITTLSYEIRVHPTEGTYESPS